MKPTAYFLLTICIVITAICCSVLKKEDHEKDVQTFLTSFQTDLVKTDDEILTHFGVRQTREAVLSVIGILRNEDPFIVCNAAFANATITVEQPFIKVEVPVTFRVKDLDTEDEEAYSFVFWLTADDQKFTITEMDGEGFYQTFSNIKNRNEWRAKQELATKDRLWIYENARKLEAQFDSVIWYSTYGTQNYFYVVDGRWTNYFMSYDTKHQRNDGTHMGLVNANGEIIIPLEYDLIGSIGFEDNNLVEVKKNGKVGYFDIAKKQVVAEPKFDLIIPCHRWDIWAVVKQDTTYGWLDAQFNYQAGLPTEQVKKWVSDFEFLKTNIQLKAGEKTFCEIPSPDETGNGIIVPPFYLSKHRIFDEIEGNISTTPVPVNGWIEYKETTNSFLEKVSNNIMAVVTTVRERYLEGREEFYTGSQLVFVNQQHDTVEVASISGEQISMHTIDSSLLEVRTPHDYWFGEYDASEENNLYQHVYFAISGKEIKPLKSDRLYPQTQYVKLDSSYLKGKFTLYSSKTQQDESTPFLSAKTITYMRDEILASYGYRFPDSKRVEQFQQFGKWYNPHHDNISEIEAEMSAVDRHNLAFLNKVLALMPAPAV